MACDSSIPADRLNNSSSFSTWYTNTTVAVNAITSENTALQNLESDITKTLACAQTTFQSQTNAPSSITRLTSELTTVRGELEQAKKNATLARDRAQMLTSPEKRTTVYEGWFPLFRPLQLTSMLIIIGFGLFFLCVALGLTTKLLGFHIQLGYELPFAVAPSRPGGWNPLLIGGGVLVTVLVGVIIYAFTRKS